MVTNYTYKLIADQKREWVVRFQSNSAIESSDGYFDEFYLPSFLLKSFQFISHQFTGANSVASVYPDAFRYDKNAVDKIFRIRYPSHRQQLFTEIIPAPENLICLSLSLGSGKQRTPEFVTIPGNPNKNLLSRLSTRQIHWVLVSTGGK